MILQLKIQKLVPKIYLEMSNLLLYQFEIQYHLHFRQQFYIFFRSQEFVLHYSLFV